MHAMKRRAAAHEHMYAREKEMDFMAQARRNGHLGHWAAGMIGSADPEQYAREIVHLTVTGDKEVVDRLRNDLTVAGIEINDEMIQERMVEFLNRAARELRDAA